MKNIVLVGATSGMAMAVARLCAERNDRLFLVARDETKLKMLSQDLYARGSDKVGTFSLDVNDIEKHRDMFDEAENTLGGCIDLVIIAHGTLPDQIECQKLVDSALREFNTNAVSTMALLTELANRFEKQKSGTIAVISSVAGDRGRPSNYVYGAAKAAVSTYLEGLRARLFKSGVHVLDIKPGFVATPMTQDLELPDLLTVTPDKVAKDIISAIEKKRDVIYTPFFWKYIMLIIKSIPRTVFKRLGL
ncbi:SDR family oxidoreductase [Vibrio hannami]|uniref:SDR family oxidoreductase n=1 Tax=Vibrio hannami TaxID=2717094 RepID=UPI00240FD4A5|nr:SDR family oxidoreductase [Vibrio hannami]MDG3086934.1 SDR family oxidoreductase [Vibrio hannami]